MWQSKTIKHWLGSTSQDVTVNRKSELRGSISCGVSKMLWGPKQPSVLRVAKQQTGSQWSAWPEPGWGHTAPWAMLRARQAADWALQGHPVLRKERSGYNHFLLLQPRAGCAGTVQELLQAKEQEEKCLNGSCPLSEAYLIKQDMLPGCQNSSLAFQSVLEELLVQGWALPVLGDIAPEKNLKCRREAAHGM